MEQERFDHAVYNRPICETTCSEQVLAVETALVLTMSVCYHSILFCLVSTSLR